MQKINYYDFENMLKTNENMNMCIDQAINLNKYVQFQK